MSIWMGSILATIRGRHHPATTTVGAAQHPMSTTLTPFVVYSDGPGLPTGLARIARDLTSRIFADREALEVSVLQVGWDPKPRAAVPWPTYGVGGVSDASDWGARELRESWQEWFGEVQGVCLSVWDASRAFALLGAIQGIGTELWGYFPVDGCNVNGSIGGPAKECLQRYDRVLAYGRWGSEVIGTIRKPVPYLPHGLDLDRWTYQTRKETLGHVERYLKPREGHWILGCVATNQPRKDLGLYFATLAELRRRGQKVLGWLHTDCLVRSWSVGQLAEDFGVERYVRITLGMTDEELAACYACCGVTLAPGLGEGLGYPIIESLACGTPPVHVNYAGGAELVPLQAWRIPYRAERLEGVYGLRRPVVTAVDAANAIEQALDWKRQEERVCQAYCRGSVAHLAWDRIWPRWRGWIKQGLDGYREGL